MHRHPRLTGRAGSAEKVIAGKMSDRKEGCGELPSHY